MLEAEATPCADLLRLRWAIRGVDSERADPGAVDVRADPLRGGADGAIAKIRLLLGERPLRAVSDRCGVAPVGR